jgi:polar amino acid transport system substrate-binding protein
MIVSVCLTMWGHDLAAQPCGGNYVIMRGDSLSGIAERHYRNAFRWTRIYDENRPVIGPDPDKILAGTSLYLPCLDERSAALTQDEQTLSPPIVSLVPPQGDELAVTASGPALLLATGREFPPFSRSGERAEGMFMEVLQAALVATKPAPEIRMSHELWAELSGITGGDGETVVTFPWPGPDCTADLVRPSCRDMLYSEPLFELLIVVFAPEDAPLPFLDPKDLEGRVLCRSEGLTAHMLDHGAYGWLNHDAIEVIGATTPEACFALLVDGAVDGVVVNEFTGRATVAAMGLTGIMDVMSPPLGITTLHAAVPASDRAASETLQRINNGLGTIRANGQFQDILDRHLVQAWAGY